MTVGAVTQARQAYGLAVRPEFALPVVLPPARPAAHPMLIRRGRTARETGSVLIWRTRIDGRSVVFERTPTNAVHVSFGEDAEFRIDADASTVTCAPRREAEPLRWQRFLLDTILWSAAVVRGRIALHAAAVADGAGAVAILGGTGSGKTSLALAFLRRGRALVADDVVVVSPADGRIIAHPAPPVMNVELSKHLVTAPRVGRFLGKLDDEHWVAVHRSVVEPAPLRAVAVLSRADESHGTTHLDETHAFFALDAHSVSLPYLPRSHANARFEILTEVAARVPVLELRVPRSLSPDEIADVLDAKLAADHVQPVGNGHLQDLVAP